MGNESEKIRFDDILPNDVITETALALVGVKDGVWIPLGSCVVIGSNLAITAKHVPADFLSRHVGLKTFRGSWRVSGEILARQILSDQESERLLHVTRIWFSAFTDVAFLYLIEKETLIKQYEWKPCTLKVSPPQVGDRIVGFGYHNSIVLPGDSDVKTNIQWKDSKSATVGEVIEIYPVQRDSSMLPFPCYRTNARFERGMSGGPVFNDDGNLCGLICASMKGDPAEPYISHVVTLWPCLATHIEVKYPENPQADLVVVYDLAKLGYISVVDLETVVKETNENGETVIGFPRSEKPIDRT